VADIELLDYLKDYKPVRIFLINLDGEQINLDCVCRVIRAPFLEARFLEGTLPSDQLSLTEHCVISLDTGVGTLSLRADIDEVRSSTVLSLKLIDAVNHVQKRDAFRVDTSLVVRLYNEDEVVDDAVSGEVINLSGGGMMVMSPQFFPSMKKLHALISLPANRLEVVHILVRVVRVIKETGNRFRLALEFEEMRQEDRDKIFAHCFAEQRRQLRMKTRVVGPGSLF